MRNIKGQPPVDAVREIETLVERRQMSPYTMHLAAIEVLRTAHQFEPDTDATLGDIIPPLLPANANPLPSNRLTSQFHTTQHAEHSDDQMRQWRIYVGDRPDAEKLIWKLAVEACASRPIFIDNQSQTILRGNLTDFFNLIDILDQLINLIDDSSIAKPPPTALTEFSEYLRFAIVDSLGPRGFQR